MIMNFSVENYMSFLEEQKITFEHEYNKANIFKNNTIFEFNENKKKKAILNGAIIFGANAAGKSNVVNAINTMKNYFNKSLKFDRKEDISVKLNSFKFVKNQSNEIQFNIEFMNEIENKYYKIHYQFSINPKTSIVEREKLSYRTVLKTTLSNEVVVFLRDKNKIIDSSGEIELIVNKIKQENIEFKLFLTLLNFDINPSYFEDEICTLSYKIIKSCGESINNDLIFSNETNNLGDFYEEISINSAFKEYILKSLYEYDFALVDFTIQDITEEFIESLKNNGILGNLSDEEKVRILNNFREQKKYKVDSIHQVNNESYPLPLAAESAGTKKFLSHSLKIYESILKNRIYITDEFDSHYHHFIQEGIIRSFIYQDDRNSKTQFLIITHNPLLITQKYFAKEQICFVEKDRRTQESKIYSLKDFPNVSYNNHNWLNLYLEGRIGAVPEVF